jgi:hypothetical protein
MKRTAAIELEIVELYKQGDVPVSEIRDTYHLEGGNLYHILDKYGVPRRNKSESNGNGHTNGNGKKPPAPSAPKREWFLIDECVAITGFTLNDIEWFIRKGVVYSEESTTISGGKMTMVYLPSLMEATEHASIDGKRAKQLLQEAWTMLEKVSRQRAINLEDAKFITTAIRDFFVLNGWTLG